MLDAGAEKRNAEFGLRIAAFNRRALSSRRKTLQIRNDGWRMSKWRGGERIKGKTTAVGLYSSPARRPLLLEREAGKNGV
jgi:hypothetical protein